MLFLIKRSGRAGAQPSFGGGPSIFRVDDGVPVSSVESALAVKLASGIRVVDAPVGARSPNELRQTVGKDAKMFLASLQGLFCSLLSIGPTAQFRRSLGQRSRQGIKLANAGGRRSDRAACHELRGKVL